MTAAPHPLQRCWIFKCNALGSVSSSAHDVSATGFHKPCGAATQHTAGCKHDAQTCTQKSSYQPKPTGHFSIISYKGNTLLGAKMKNYKYPCLLGHYSEQLREPGCSQLECHHVSSNGNFPFIKTTTWSMLFIFHNHCKPTFCFVYTYLCPPLRIVNLKQKVSRHLGKCSAQNKHGFYLPMNTKGCLQERQLQSLFWSWRYLFLGKYFFRKPIRTNSLCTRRNLKLLRNRSNAAKKSKSSIYD